MVRDVDERRYKSNDRALHSQIQRAMFRFLTLVLAFVASAYGASIADRVVGGSDAPAGVHRGMVSLQNWFGSHFCGGSIINNEWIMTAAHCVQFYESAPGWIRVVVGTNRLDQGGTIYGIEAVISHPSYDPRTIRNDIALMKTARPMVFNDKVQPIPLESGNVTDVTAVLSGWGTTSYPNGQVPIILQEITLELLNIEDCKAKHEWVTDSNICTSPVVGEGACHGDSGGPLVSEVSGKQIGIVSWGMQPCAKGESDVYTSVSSYTDFIENTQRNYVRRTKLDK